MKLTREEKLLIIDKVNSGELTVQQVMQEYGISRTSAYRMLKNPPTEKPKKPYTPVKNNVVQLTKKTDEIDIVAYQNMTKDELIRELILSKANELRAKKGYEVKGDGANKEFISLNNKNSK